MDLIGQTLGNYQIIEVVGHGGMSSVYRAFQTSLNRSVAIKVLSSAHTRDPMFRERFDREAKAVAQLSHPNIVPIYDFGNDERRGLLYLVMEYVSGGNLRDRARNYLSIKDAVDIIVPIAHALDYAHGRGIIHRDIKPSNILLTETSRPLLSDFGLVKLSDSSLSTESGFTIGTPAYMSPEQVMGETLDGRSDIYSLAMVLYELVTGRPAFQGDTPLALLHQQVYEPPLPPRQLNGRISRAMEEVLLCALHKSRDERYQTGAEFAAAVENALNEKNRAPAPVAAVAKPATTNGRDAAAQAVASELEADDVSKEHNLSFAAWLIGTLLKLALVTALLAAMLGLGGALALGVFAERTISAYTWNWSPLSAEQPTVIGDETAQNQIEQYLRANVSDRLLNPHIGVHFQPGDNLQLSGEGQTGRVVIGTRVFVVGGALQVAVEEVNGIRPYILGSIVSDGINRGLRQAFASAPLKLERSATATGQITLYPRKPDGASSSNVYPLPAATVR